jgi:TatD DNase family protein
MIYDSHAHMDYFSEKEIQEIMENSKEVKVIITNSTDLKSCKANFKISKKYPKIKLAAGLYPGKELKKEDFKPFKEFVLSNKSSIVAIGEIGMDFSESEDKETQEYIFKEQLKLAKQLNLPAIIHTRKAEKEVLEILEKNKDQKIILHFFHANFKLIKKAEELGFYFSIPTNITKSQHFQKMVGELPKDKILTETDSPYLSPHEGKQNQPAYIKESIKVISKIWKIPKSKVEQQIEKNFKKVFN